MISLKVTLSGDGGDWKTFFFSPLLCICHSEWVFQSPGVQFEIDFFIVYLGGKMEGERIEDGGREGGRTGLND